MEGYFAKDEQPKSEIARNSKRSSTLFSYFEIARNSTSNFEISRNCILFSDISPYTLKDYLKI